MRCEAIPARMPGPSAIHQNHKPRELRRRVMLRARMRANLAWSDACILNVSSRGLMINAATRGSLQGNVVELWHGEHVIVATVVWQKGTRAGLQSESAVPVDDVLALSHAPALQLTAAEWPQVERRKKPRNPDQSRSIARAIEFAGIVVIAASLAAGAFTLVNEAFARPLSHVEAALAG